MTPPPSPGALVQVMPLAHGGMLHSRIEERRAAAAGAGRVDEACVGFEAKFYLAEVTAT